MESVNQFQIDVNPFDVKDLMKQKEDNFTAPQGQEFVKISKEMFQTIVNMQAILQKERKENENVCKDVVETNNANEDWQHCNLLETVLEEVKNQEDVVRSEPIQEQFVNSLPNNANVEMSVGMENEYSFGMQLLLECFLMCIT